MTLMTAGTQVIDGQAQTVNDGKMEAKMNSGPKNCSKNVYTNIEMYREEALRSSRRMSDHGQGTTAWRAFLPDQYRVKGLIVTFCIGSKSDNGVKAQGKIWEMDDR
jgi:hypothetical protein